MTSAGSQFWGTWSGAGSTGESSSIREGGSCHLARGCTRFPHLHCGSGDWSVARIRYERLATERSNPRSRALDRLSPGAIARLMNRADLDALRAVGRAAPAIGRAVAAIVERLGH